MKIDKVLEVIHSEAFDWDESTDEGISPEMVEWLAAAWVGEDADSDWTLYGYKEIAAIINTTEQSLRAYRCSGYMPQPDEMVGGYHPRWRKDTIMKWKEQRAAGTNTRRTAG